MASNCSIRSESSCTSREGRGGEGRDTCLFSFFSSHFISLPIKWWMSPCKGWRDWGVGGGAYRLLSRQDLITNFSPTHHALVYNRSQQPIRSDKRITQLVWNACGPSQAALMRTSSKSRRGQVFFFFNSAQICWCWGLMGKSKESPPRQNFPFLLYLNRCCN